MQVKPNLVLSGCTLGLLGTVTQVLIIRELLVAFTGNELTIATVLAIWLVSVALGCVMANRLIRPEGSRNWVAALFIMAGLFSLMQVILVRLVRPLIAPIGELLGPDMVVATTAIGVIPCAAALGALFVLIVRYGSRRGHIAPLPAVYGGEALGSGLAGVLLGIWLLDYLNPISILCLCALLSAGFGILMLRNASPASAPAKRAAAVVWPALAVLALIFGARIDLALRGV